MTTSKKIRPLALKCAKLERFKVKRHKFAENQPIQRKSRIFHHSNKNGYYSANFEGRTIIFFQMKLYSVYFSMGQLSESIFAELGFIFEVKVSSRWKTEQFSSKIGHTHMCLKASHGPQKNLFYRNAFLCCTQLQTVNLEYSYSLLGLSLIHI